MISEELLKSVIRIKFEAVNTITSMLPYNMQEHAQKLENQLINAIHEVTKEYIDKNYSVKNKKTLTTIEIE